MSMKEEKLFFSAIERFCNPKNRLLFGQSKIFFKYNGGARELQTYPKTLPRL